MTKTPAPERVVGGRYRLLRKLGQGGGGTTWEAQDEREDRRVAVKELTVAGAEDWKSLELAEREAKVAVQLEHPQIPRYIEAFTEEGARGPALYLVRELVVGQPLDALIDQGVRFSDEEVDALVEQMLDVLIYLQQLTPPVFHRDIKPANIIRDDEHSGQFRLVDFGAVNAPDKGKSGTTVVGTFGYMAPEQFRGSSGPQTDLFGLGMTLVHLLSHRHPADLPTEGLEVDIDECLAPGPRRRWISSLIRADSRQRPADAHAARAALRVPAPVEAASPGGRGYRWAGLALVMLGVAVLGGAYSVLLPVEVSRGQPAPPVVEVPPPNRPVAPAPEHERHALNLGAFCKLGLMPVRMDLHFPAPDDLASCARRSRETETNLGSYHARRACSQKHPFGKIPKAVASIHVASCVERQAPATGVMLTAVACCDLKNP